MKNTFFYVDLNLRLLSELVGKSSVILAELEVCASNKLEFVKRDADRLEHGLDDVFIVLCAFGQQRPGSLHIVQVGVQIRKQDRHLGSGNIFKK